MNSVHESVIEIFIRGIRGSILFLPFLQEPLVFDQDFEYALFLFFSITAAGSFGIGAL